MEPMHVDDVFNWAQTQFVANQRNPIVAVQFANVMATCMLCKITSQWARDFTPTPAPAPALVEGA